MYRFLTVPGKLVGEVRLAVDNRPIMFTSIYDGGTSTSLTLFPTVILGIMRQMEKDMSGRYVKPTWNPNDRLSLTQYNLPKFIEEFEGIYNDMKKPELYTYHGDRLELNETLAAKIRRAFIVSATTVELSPVVITKEDSTQIEGIKMKFNNEASSILLTLDEMNSILYNVKMLDVNSIVLQMFDRYIYNAPNADRQFERVTTTTHNRRAVNINDMATNPVLSGQAGVSATIAVTKQDPNYGVQTVTANEAPMIEIPTQAIQTEPKPISAMSPSVAETPQTPAGGIPAIPSIFNATAVDPTMATAAVPATIVQLPETRITDSSLTGLDEYA